MIPKEMIEALHDKLVELGRRNPAVPTEGDYYVPMEHCAGALAAALSSQWRGRDAEVRELLDDLADLHKQATIERSHYYVGKCVQRSISMIERLANSRANAGANTRTKRP